MTLALLVAVIAMLAYVDQGLLLRFFCSTPVYASLWFALRTMMELIMMLAVLVISCTVVLLVMVVV